MSVQVGQTAPDFKLFNTEKKEVSLSDFSGKNVVILFFPFAFSSTCTEELCSVRDNLQLYKNLNAVVLGISVDSLFALARFKAEQALPFELLSDFNKEVGEAYGILYPQWGFGYRGVGKRSVFVLDGERKVLHTEVLENAGELPDLKTVVNCLEKIET